MNCQRCCKLEEAIYRVHSDLIDMNVCAVCADEARRLGIAVEILGGGGRKDSGEKNKLELTAYRSDLLLY
jgi:hypothetical protein